MAHIYDKSNQSFKRDESSINIDPDDRETIKTQVDDEINKK